MRERWGIWSEEDDDFIGLNYASYAVATEIANVIRRYLEDQGMIFTGFYIKEQCMDHATEPASQCCVCDVYAEEF